MAQRRTPRGGPAGSRRPGERSGHQRVRTSPAAATPTADAASPSKRRRPRLTGRAAILVLLVAVLTVSYASSMRAYLQQRSHINDLKEQIAARQSAIDDLEREKQRWHDPAFVAAQARERFGYVMPGETSYVVLDE
jgi:cell division protein FtsB